MKLELIEIYKPGQQPEDARRLARGTFEEIGPRANIRMSDVSEHKLELSELIADRKAKQPQC